MRVLTVTQRCDLCTSDFEEGTGRMDIGWVWNGKALEFDVDDQCLEKIDLVPLGTLLRGSRPATKGKKAKLQSQAKAAMPNPQQGLQGTKPRIRVLEATYREQQILRTVGGVDEWHCPECVHVAVDRSGLDGHCHRTHGNGLSALTQAHIEIMAEARSVQHAVAVG